MPVTKTAKRALRSSLKKQGVNKTLVSKLEASLRIAKRSKKEKDVKIAISLTDRASKKKIIHTNKAARIKSTLSKLLPIKNKIPRAKAHGILT
jgi:ribosomal protein S20